MNTAILPEAIVIGGSTGAFAELRRLLRALPARFPVPIAAVLHIAPGRASGLADGLSHGTPLAVAEALDKAPFEAGHVYVAPPDYHLLIEPDRTLSLSCDAPVLFSRPAIDPLFESAAEVYGSALLAILLSGASRDGCDGIAAVRRAGGIAWVQAPETAEAAYMPSEAILHGGADRVLDIDTMASMLGGLAP